MKSKISRLIAISCITFAGINLLDLVLTLCFFEGEINPLVLANPSLFYVIKLISSFFLLTIGWYKLTD